jgi:SOS-response transcriptional repressor LexA
MIRNLSRGRSKGLKGDQLINLAALLDVSPEWLQGDGQAIQYVGAAPARVPLISWVHAGQLELDTYAQDLLGEIDQAGLDPAGDWVAMRVVGDSMDRISPPDSIIFVDRNDKKLVPNGLYILYDGDEGSSYKRYRPNPTRFEPVSTNPSHEPLFLDREPVVFGRVKKTVLDL